jgi:hypothetical protein
MDVVSRYLVLCCVTVVVGVLAKLSVLAILGASLIAPVYAVGLVVVSKEPEGAKISLAPKRLVTDIAVLVCCGVAGLVFNSFPLFLIAAMPLVVIIKQALKN